jgi:ATP adenylyltransferase
VQRTNWGFILAKKISKSKALKKDGKWPLKRQVMFRPQRFAYINEQRSKAAVGCVFCDSLKAGVGVESLLVAETPHAMVVLNKFPYNPGHVMVLPRRHHGDLTTLEAGEYKELMNLVKVTVAALKQAFHAENFNVGINLGKGAGAGIPDHLHVHIVPRWPGDLNFFPLLAETKVIPSDMPTIFLRIQPVLKDLIHASGEFT